MKTRQSMLLGMAALAALSAGGGMPQGFAPGASPATVQADPAARGENGARPGSLLARILGSNGRRGKLWETGFNGRAHSGVAAQKRQAHKRRRYLAQKAIGKRACA